jgi:hypothetical protein
MVARARPESLWRLACAACDQSQYLTPLGLLLFSLSFILVGMTAGPYLLRRATMTTISLQSVGLQAEQVDLRQAEALMRSRCARCHNLDRVVGARKDAQGWLETVNRMRALPSSGISEAEARSEPRALPLPLPGRTGRHGWSCWALRPSRRCSTGAARPGTPGRRTRAEDAWPLLPEVRARRS